MCSVNLPYSVRLVYNPGNIFPEVKYEGNFDRHLCDGHLVRVLPAAGRQHPLDSRPQNGGERNGHREHRGGNYPVGDTIRVPRGAGVFRQLPPLDLPEQT